MDEVNGAVLLLYPKEPMVNWATKVYSGAVEPTLTEMQEYPTAIYVDRLWRNFTMDSFLAEHYREILQHEFSTWTQDENLWPAMSPQLLTEWFKSKLIIPLYRVD